MFLTPLHFELKVDYYNHNIEYHNLREIAQGGPLVGQLSINGIALGGNYNYEFGGPLLCYNKYIIIPFYRRFRFRLCVIDIDSMQIKVSDFSERLILLKGINDEHVEYFIDLDNTNLKKCSLNALLLSENISLKKKRSFWDFF